MWLMRRLTPDFKVVADFQQDKGAAIRKVCAPFGGLRRPNLFSEAIIAIVGFHGKSRVT